MPQKTNLNTNPYYDDFDAAKNFYKVLFKPGFPVQARELTTIQSLLQNQIESFGNHFFKDGSVVIPGTVSYDGDFYAVKLNSTHLGNNISLYLSQLVGKEIRGEVSQVKAVVRHYIPASQSEEGYETLYIKYRGGNNNNEFSPFLDGEQLITGENIVFGSTSIPAGETFASTIDLDATAIGSACAINEGIYFIRGTFIRVDQDLIVLDQYSNTPSYRVGLTINEEIVTSKADDSLYDNAKGFSNYSAPGSDRLKISTTLSKKGLNDFDDKNFVEILRVTNGELKKIQDKTEYNSILDYLAKRTYEESGDYSVTPFEVEVDNSLNDEIGSSGVYLSSQKTDDGRTPSDNLMAYKISPGKAYVRGYDISTKLSIIDVEKPRLTDTVNLTSIPFEMGSLLKVNNVIGSPKIELKGDNTIDLYGRRSSGGSPQGDKVGEARIYSFNSSNQPYVDESSEFDLYLYDVQTYTKITLNEDVDSNICPTTSYIKGSNSSASGYVVSIASDVVTLSQTSGEFVVGEQIQINGTTDNPRTIKSIVKYSISDIRSVYQDLDNAFGWGANPDFLADTVLERKIPNRFTSSDRITIASNGSVSGGGKSFIGIKPDTVVVYQYPGSTVVSYNRVSSVAADGLTMTLVAESDVGSFIDGDLPAASVTVPFTIGVAELKNEENSFLYAKLFHNNVASADLSKTNLTIYNQVIGKSTDGSGSLSVSIADTGLDQAFFEPFDTERYSVVYSNGSIEQLTSDQVVIGSQSTDITINGLLTNQSNVVVNVTVRKASVRSKIKKYQRSRTLTIGNTKKQQNTSNGLSYNSYYGLRVEDEEISLNTTDVVKVHAVYESLDSNAPVLDSLTFLSTLSLNSASIVGEKVRGNDSGAIAQIVAAPSASKIEIVYLNQSKFSIGETVKFEESGIQGILQAFETGKYINRTSNYRLDKGQKEQIYDYSKLVRESGVEPNRQVTVVYDRYTSPSNDTGDVYTVNSYDKERYTTDIPVLTNGTRCSDILDFRPQLSDFTSTSTSPFAWSSRTSFASSSNNAILSPNESSLIGYSYYLPRIDKILLHKDGSFKLISGAAELNPKEPNLIEDGMHIATITLPAYLYKPEDAKIVLADNRRYTMRDIGKIEDRVEVLEETTSLSLLELDTKTLQIQDSEGLSRFKTGFFVDDFKNLDLMDVGNPDLKCTIRGDEKTLTSKIDYFTLKTPIAPETGVSMENLSFDTNFNLLDPNIQKTGDFVTLKYETSPWRDISQTLATRVENVNPFAVIDMEGNMVLSPASDTWIREIVINRGRSRFTWGSWNGSYLENVLMSTQTEQFMRSRNVQFYATGLASFTRHYTFLDKNPGIDIVPKLLEIAMVSGQFQVGETVDGFDGGQRVISFRVANQNHKKGAFNSPSVIYSTNPYNNNQNLPGYNSASTVINVDTSSLSESADGRFSGYIKRGITLVGRSSRAEATVTNNRLVSDDAGTIIGSFFIRDPNASPAPIVKIRTGAKIFKISSSSIDESDLPTGYKVSSAESGYSASGILRIYETVRVTVRRPPPPPPPPPPRRRGDPLAQTFTTDVDGGFLSSVDLWFQQKDLNIGLVVEIRHVDLGLPTNILVEEHARVELSPNDVVVSNDARDSAYTRATFPAPVYLEPDTEYAIVILAPQSINYYSWIARVGEKTTGSANLPNVESVIYSRQFVGGSLFKSQNGTVWTPSQFEDLKFRCNKCNFTSNSGTAYFYNPSLQYDTSFSDENVYNTIEDPIKTLPRKLIVGINTTTYLDSVLTNGTKVGVGNTVIGYIEQVGAGISQTSGTTITSGGRGYTQGTYNDVPLYTISGNGSGATAQVTVNSSGVVTGITITGFASGSGYSVGDVLGITTSSVANTGSGALVSVSAINGIDTLYLTNVYGETFYPNASTPLVYYSGSTAVSMAGTFVQSSEVLNPFYEGNVIEVFDRGHAMHSVSNKVSISNVFPTTVPVKLSEDVASSSTSIVVDNVGIFTSFENRPVSIANTGYALIDNEIISYTSTGSNSLDNITRFINNSPTRSHKTGTLCYKYELNGVSLMRINTNHNMASNDNVVFRSNTIDTYYLTIDRTGRDSGDNQISFQDERSVGGNNCVLSQNLQFNTITPQYNVFTPGNSKISAEMRTISGTSVDGTETSFVDMGYEPIELNSENVLSSTRLIASHVNEVENLSELPRNKSLTIALKMENGGNANISPVVDLRELCTIALGRNRLNKPFDNYANNPGANLESNDPHSSIYISKKIQLAKPATSLKVLLGAYRDSSADFRVFYKLFKSDSSEISQSYVPFPGYDNLIDTDGDGFGDNVINLANNSGLPDRFVRASAENEFLEYQFTADDLDQFTSFIIKIVMNGQDESKPVRIKDLRVLSLA